MFNYYEKDKKYSIIDLKEKMYTLGRVYNDSIFLILNNQILQRKNSELRKVGCLKIHTPDVRTHCMDLNKYKKKTVSAIQIRMLFETAREIIHH